MVRSKAGDNRSMLFNEKEYKDGIDDLSKKTVVRATDLDDKAIKFLDYLQMNGGRAKDACQHLETSALQGLQRDHVTNWRAYVYTLLRGFDTGAYEAMKTGEGKRVRKPLRNPRAEILSSLDKKEKFPLSTFTFNPEAAEFIPGQQWGVPPATATVTLDDEAPEAAEGGEAKPEEKGDTPAAEDEEEEEAVAEPKAEEEKKD
eukprot:CAMPEP_0175565284 /NCGR_PEP_ID=MMETSP0096-20121207/39365_1 /TAXON_ID=311494 /ORGANISM="Alexandrium monilatum, Strain CCMP3105" /LENGTH=201 /DNA_ID=CAMNT_0016868567 /DNA_START=1 /DNA_END=606 /DNA_ORIENTATION=-